jgi:hypothetical protein
VSWKYLGSILECAWYNLSGHTGLFNDNLFQMVVGFQIFPGCYIGICGATYDNYEKKTERAFASSVFFPFLLVVSARFFRGV